nr:flagellar hook-basal body complex protein [uncultured Oscillibacter sp.]
MTGSMYASIAGLKAHMQKLTVIGNNVANVNTTAYKKQRTVFRDSIYSMYSSGSNGSETVGGMNPSQLGYGSLVASIDLDMSTSSYNPGNPMDCAIVGDGFFLVGTKDQAANIDPRNPESFKSLLLTRTGDFRFSADGYLTDGMGNTVYGFLTTGLDEDGKPTVSDQLVPIRFPRMQKTIVDKKTGKPVDTTTATDIWADAEHTKLNEEKYAWSYEVKYPVDKATGDNNQGGGTTNTPSYVPIEDYNPLIHEKNDNQGGNTGNNQETDTTNPLAYAELESITIDKKTGCISGVTKDGGIKVVVGYLSLGVVTNPNGVTHTSKNYYLCGDGAGDLRVTMLGGVNKELGITHVNGSLKDYGVDNTQGGNTGTGTDTEDELPQMAEVTSSGDVSLMTGFLEAPNVDLATEISELITTQRGYQANTRIITVTDSMLEELVNMKR